MNQDTRISRVRNQSRAGAAAGFTLLELLVVIAIIGTITAIFIVSIGQSRQKSENTSVIAQMGEYETALNFYYSDNGVFPGPASAVARATERCLGQGSANGGCWGGASAGDTYLAAALVPDYMPELPGFDQGTIGSPAFNGCASSFFNDNSSCTQTDFSLYFLLEGTSQDCGRFHTADNNYSGNTMCIVQMSIQ